MSEDVFGPAWRWSFWGEPTSLRVCTGEHPKHDPCQYRPATEDEARVHDEIEDHKRATALRKEPDGEEEGRR